MLFGIDDINEALAALVTELVRDGAEARIRIVGEAAVALQIGREALTADIDALYSSSPAVRAAADRIAHARGWPAGWLNDAVKMYASHFDDDGDWTLQAEERGVVVLIARPPLLLAMKLLAGRGRRDSGDIERLLDACEITSVGSALEVFEHYFPQEVVATPAMRQLHDRFN